VIETWLDVAELEATTRHSYEGYIRRQILPTLGNMPARKLESSCWSASTPDCARRAVLAASRWRTPQSARSTSSSGLRSVRRSSGVAAGDPAALGDASPVRPGRDPAAERRRREPVAWHCLEEPDLGTLLWVAIITGVRCRSSLRPAAAVHSHVGTCTVTSEGVVLDVAPAESVHGLREALRAAIADVWSAERIPETGKEFIPHVSLAYSNADVFAAVGLDAG
jgi:hypothetical protein